MMSMNVIKSTGWKMLLFAIAAALLAPAAVRADEEKIEDVAGHMEIISRNFKKLRRQLDDVDANKESAALVEEMVAHAKKAMEMEPPLAKDLSGDAKAKFLEGYKKMMAATIEEMGNLKKAFAENRNADAAVSYKKLLDFKKEGHEKYTE